VCPVTVWCLSGVCLGLRDVKSPVAVEHKMESNSRAGNDKGH
jgi:hypothetical protein